MEHVQPLDRPFPWRTATLSGALLLVVALLAVGTLALAHRPERTHPVAATGRGPNGPAARPLRPRSRISVLVLNGNGISGAAGGEATQILARGYRHAVPADAPSLDYARSIVLFRPGFAPEAKRLAREAGIPAVAPLDGRVAAPYERVPLVVILGAS